MKAIAFILSVVILFMSVNPCSDEQTHGDTAHTALSSSHDHEDHCLAICVCQCCGTTITFESVGGLELKSYGKISTDLIISYEEHYRFDFGTKLWHPPRVTG